MEEDRMELTTEALNLVPGAVGAGTFTMDGQLLVYNCINANIAGGKEQRYATARFCAAVLTTARALAEKAIHLSGKGFHAQTLVWVDGGRAIGIKPIDSTKGLFVEIEADVSIEGGHLLNLTELNRELSYLVVPPTIQWSWRMSS